jgi:hypothetical protein
MDRRYKAIVIAVARKHYASEDIEIEDYPDVTEADGGCWVRAWCWIPDPERGAKRSAGKARATGAIVLRKGS